VVGTTLGHYRVLQKLRGGGTGDAYAAEDTKLGRRVALRPLAAEMLADPPRLARFEREARAVAALAHPNIVSIYSVEEAGGVRFLTLELIEGRTLDAVVPAGGLPLDDLLTLAVPLADAVAVAHEHGIVHGDLKPSKIIVTEDGRLKVLDFGLATLKRADGSAELEFGATTVGGAAEAATTVVGAADTTTTAAAVGETARVAGAPDAPAVGAGDATYLATQLTERHAAVGSAACLSPEQLEGRAVDHRSDIFSLGVVLYEMACGQRPFGGDTALSVISSIITDTPPPVSSLNRAVPAALGRLITRALAKDPAERQQSARDLCGELRQLQERAASRRVASTLLRVVAGSRWAPRLAVATVLLVLVVAGALVLAPRHPRPDAAPTAASLHFRVEQLTSESGVEQFPSLTPDGRSVVYAGQQSGNWDIYVRGTSGQAAINLTADSPAEDNEPAVSRDGERIAFRSTRDGGGIFVMGRAGGGVNRVTPAGVANAFNPAWSPDGTEIAYTTEDVQLTPLNWERASELWVVNVRTGEQRRFDVANVVQASWSPHGHRIAYASRPRASVTGRTTTSVMDIWTVPARGGEAVAVTNDPEADWSPTWAPDGRSLYFVSDRGGGGMNLWRIAIDEISGKTLGPPQPVTTPAQFLAHPAVSADGRTIVYCAKLETGNIQKIRLDPVRASVQSEPTWVTTGSRAWSNPDPSPDGSLVVAYTREQPEGDLYVLSTDGVGRPNQLTSEPQFVDRVPRWSPDGRSVAFFSTRQSVTSLWKIRSDGSGLQQVAPRSGVAVWSPDGARLAVSPRATGTTTEERTTYVFDPGSAWDAQTPEVLPRPEPAFRLFIAQDWSPDGSRLAGQLGFTSGRGDGIVVYTFATRTYERVSEFGEWPAWFPDSRRLLFVAGAKEHWVVDTRTRQKQKIYSVPRGSLGPARLTRDGRLAFFSLALREADIYLLRFEG
jgi:Tol biopolymer transport system component/serine/threonine protein kinase